MGLIPKRWGIRLDSHTFGNLLKNLAPAAGLLGGPAGIALAGGMSTLGDLGRGKNIGQSLKGSVGNMALAGGVSHLSGGNGLTGVKQKLGQLFSPGSGGGAATPAYPGGPTTSMSGSWLPGTGTAGQSAPVASLASKVGGAAKYVGKTVKDNPLVVGQVASGVLGARAQDAQTGLQREAFDFQKQQYTDQEARRRRLQELLAPVLASYQPRGM